MSDSIRKKIYKGAITILFVRILAKFASFISEAVLAAYLGTTAKSDAYYMVAGIQQVIYPMLSVGIWKVFLPIYKDKITKGEQLAADRLTDEMISFFTLVSVGVVALMIVFSPQIVTWIAPGFEGETRQLTIEMVRIAAPSYILIIAAAIYASMLQCHNKFFGSQIREVVTHIPVILAAVLFYHHFGIKVMAIALVVGSLVRLLIELVFVDWGYRYKPNFRFKGEEFRLMLQRLPSAMLSEGVHQVNAFVDKNMASRFPEGAVSSLNYGHRLHNVFNGLLSTAISTALFPQMIELISNKKQEELNKLVVRIMNIFALLMIPVTLACVLFDESLVTLVFKRGAFQERSLALTSSIFACYSIGLIFEADSRVLSNVFFGNGNTKTPLLISCVVMVVNVGLNYLLAYVLEMQVMGLALATSLSAALGFILRLILSRKHVRLEAKTLLRSHGKVLLASCFACGLAYLLVTALKLTIYLRLFVAAAVGIALYLAAVKLLRVREVEDLHRLLRKKLKKS